MLNELIELVDDINPQQKMTLDDIVSFIIKVSSVIPLFFVADEIQEFQSSNLLIDDMDESGQNSKSKETALHYFTRILKSLTRSRILMVLSGTQYHILSQIGTKIGSPIAQKVQQIVIKNFTPNEVDEYVGQVNRLITHQMIPEGKDEVARNLLSSYRRFLHAFSGGHPRTVTLITQWFLAEFPKMVETPPSHEKFFGMLFHLVERDFKQRILTSEKQNHVKLLQPYKSFPVVKEWIVNAATRGFVLGSAPSTSSEQKNAEIEDLIFQLMTLGIIVKNGWDQYHVTSYFHLLAFLECLTGHFEQFLSQVLSNRFFQLLCGGHSGFGYTFEHVIIASLLVKEQAASTVKLLGSRTEKEPSQWSVLFSALKNITSVREVRGDINWSDVDAIKPHVLYHAPSAKAIDLFIRSEDLLILIQVNTAKKSHARKILALSKLVADVQKKIETRLNVRGWYISLHLIGDREAEKDLKSVIITTSGKDLKFILGEQLFQRLIEIKESFAS